MKRNICEKLKSDIDNAVASVCLRIIKNPLIYFSEADIQQLLVEELRRIKQIKKLYDTSVRKGKDSKGTYQTSLIHREYGAKEGTSIDIVILAPEDVAKINNVNLTIGKEYLKPEYAFELGTEKTKRKEITTHLMHDLEKLKRQTKGSGYIIHIYKDDTKSKTDTPIRKKTEEKIKEDFKKPFEEAQKKLKASPINNIKILAILLRTGRKQPNMRGKCEIFDGQQWVERNVSDNKRLREAVLKQLE